MGISFLLRLFLIVAYLYPFPYQVKEIGMFLVNGKRGMCLINGKRECSLSIEKRNVPYQWEKMNVPYGVEKVEYFL